MADSVVGEVRQHASREIVDVNVVARSLDLDGQPAAVRRDARMQVRARRKRQRFRLARSVDPMQSAHAAIRLPRDVKQRAIPRHVVVGDTGITAHHHTIDEAEWLARGSQLLCIKWDGEERPGARVEYVARRGVAWKAAALDEYGAASGRWREHRDRGIVVRLGIIRGHREQHAAGKRMWCRERPFALGCVERPYLHRVTTLT